MRGGGTGIAPFSSMDLAAPCPIPRHYSRRSASRRRSGLGAAFPSPGYWGCSTRAPVCSSSWSSRPSSPTISPTCGRFIRAYTPVTCSWPIGACVPMPISRSFPKPAYMPYCASAHDRWWILRRGGPLSGRVCGGRRPSKVSHDHAGTPRWVPTTNS
jgi:hypothetical protein